MPNIYQKGDRVIRSSEKGGRFAPHVGTVMLVTPKKLYVRYHKGYACWIEVGKLEPAPEVPNHG